MSIILGVLEEGLVYAIMALGVYITYKILDIADLTVDGSFCTGGAVCAVLIAAGVNIWLASRVISSSSTSPSVAEPTCRRLSSVIRCCAALRAPKTAIGTRHSAMLKPPWEYLSGSCGPLARLKT